MARTYFKECDGEQFDIFKGAKKIDRAVTVDDLVGRYPDAISIKPTYGEIASDFKLWDAFCGRTLPMSKEEFDAGAASGRLMNMTFQGGCDSDVFKDNPFKLGFTVRHADWIKQVHAKTGLDLHHVIELHDELNDLATKHLALHVLANEAGKQFSRGHGMAWDQIEKEMSELVADLPGITGMEFRRSEYVGASSVQFQSGASIRTVPFDDDGLAPVLASSFWVEYETRARNAAIVETISTLQATRDDWKRTAARSEGKLIGERCIIIDKHGRAFTQYVDNGQPMVKLELPSASLTGVSHMDDANAEKAQAFLESSVPDAAPFTVWDFEGYAKTQAESNERLIDQLKQRLTTASEPVESFAVAPRDDEPSGP